MGSGAEQRVLLVTADEGRRVSIRRLLKRADYQVEVAASHREAVHLLAEGGPAASRLPLAILVDQESLQSDAQLVIRAVRNAELGVPVVVLSALGAADDVIVCLQSGAIDYISLPADPRQFLDVLRRAINTPRVT